MPPQDSLAPVCETMMGHPSGPTPEPRTPSPGDPLPQHLEGQRAEVSLTREARQRGQGTQQNTERLCE